VRDDVTLNRSIMSNQMLKNALFYEKILENLQGMEVDPTCLPDIELLVFCHQKFCSTFIFSAEAHALITFIVNFLLSLLLFTS